MTNRLDIPCSMSKQRLPDETVGVNPALGSRTIDRVLEQEGKSLQRVAKSVDPGEVEIAIKVITQIATGFVLRKDR